MLSKKTLCKIMAMACTASLFLTGSKVNAENANNSFENPLPIAQKQVWSGNIFKAKPLVVLMDFKDYKHTEINNKDSKAIEDNNYAKYSSNDYDLEHYKNIFFADNSYVGPDGKDYVSMKRHLLEESGDSFYFDGGVVGWYEADHEAKYYGAKDINITDGGTDQNNASKLFKEALEKAAKDPNVDLSKYDVQDPMDVDGDGNYFESDGVIDTLIVLHPGIGEEFGGGSLGEDAIWPFQGKSFEYAALGYTMPEAKDCNNKKWRANKFILMEQNLPPDLMVHEYGHYLGLPDLYGFKSNPPVQYWSQMGGSYTGPVCGVYPLSYGAYGRDLLQEIGKKQNVNLNWSKDVSFSLEDLKQKGRDITLDQESIKGNNFNTVKINLTSNDKKIINPQTGSKAFFSEVGNDLRNSIELKNSIDLTKATSASFNFKTWYDIDPKYDFASVQVREKGTEKWISVKGNITTTENPNDQTPNDPLDRNPGNGITGSSNEKWIDGEFDLSSFLGKEIELRIYWWTDSNTPQEGIYFDDLTVKVDGQTVAYDGAEDNEKRAFNINDFKVTDGIKRGNHKYLLEWRNYANSHVDNALGSKLFNWMPGDCKYDPGLVMWYVNDEYTDQETSQHLGYSHVGVVDADQDAIKYLWKDNKRYVDDARYQLRDAAFSLKEQSILKLDWSNGAVTEDSSLMMNPIFDDSKDFTEKEGVQQVGLALPNHGIRVFVTEESSNRSTGKIHVTTNEVKEKTNQQAPEIKGISSDNNKLSIATAKKFSDTAYVSYISQDGKNEKKLKLSYNQSTGSYDGDISSLTKDTQGWKINFIILQDNDNNSKAFYNMNVNGVFGMDLSKGDINPQEQAPNITVNVESGKSYKEGLILSYTPINASILSVKLNGEDYKGSALKAGSYILSFELKGSSGQVVKKEFKFSVTANSNINWVEKDGKFYYYYPGTTTPATGWQKLDGKWYYLGTTGERYSGWLTQNGNKFYFDSNGVQYTGWLEEDGKTYYFSETGYALKGWRKINGSNYNFDDNYVMRKGWFTQNGNKFYFDSDGKAHLGWLELDGKKYCFFNTNFVLMTGWRNVDGKWYYFNKDTGEMARNTIIDGYKIGDDGVAPDR